MVASEMDGLLRRYLVGDLQDQERFEVEAHLREDEVLQRLEVVENEMIDEYVSERMNDAEAMRFEAVYLAIPTLRQRVDRARTKFLAERPVSFASTSTEKSISPLKLVAILGSIAAVAIASWLFLPLRSSVPVSKADSENAANVSESRSAVSEPKPIETKAIASVPRAAQPVSQPKIDTPPKPEPIAAKIETPPAIPIADPAANLQEKIVLSAKRPSSVVRRSPAQIAIPASGHAAYRLEWMSGETAAARQIGLIRANGKLSFQVPAVAPGNYSVRVSGVKAGEEAQTVANIPVKVLP
jgi:hypothetical protein